MTYTLRTAAILAVALNITACANQSERMPTSLAAPPETAAPQDDIGTALAGKSWRWVSPKTNLSGVTLYATDGTSLVEVTGKGTTTGTWSVKDGQLCESFAPAPFLPQGKPESCQPISGSGSRFQVGQAIFTLA